MASLLPLSLTLLLQGAALLAQAPYTFSDGGRPVQYRLATDEVFSRAGRGVRSTAGSETWGGGRIVKLSEGESPRKLVQANWAQDRKSLAPVFYSLSDLPNETRLTALPAADRARRMAAARRVMTGKLLVHLDKSQLAKLEATHPTGSEASPLEGWTLVSYADAFTALDAVDWMTQQGGFEFAPVFSRTMAKR
ncbi:MAG: hypothetical protein K2X03_01330 [Bryobacteraceae bacterium]|nr:hypothetical protein [Bryobacteraceae bacterium]